MLLWRFETYVSPSGRQDVQDTIDRYGEYDLASFSRAVAHLAVSTKDQWNEPQAKKLKNEDPLFEIRYKADRCATRALGYFGKSGQSFVIVLICTHKQNVYKPHDAFKTARSRAQQVDGGTAKTIPLQVDGEDFPPDEEQAVGQTRLP